MDRLASMRIFVSVVEGGSLSAAAKQARISGTMVGKHLKQLEQHLGVTLMQRTTRAQSLTEAGRVYFELAKQVLAQADAADEAAGALRREPRGVLRVTSVATFGTQRLVPALSRFLRAHPELKVELDLKDELVDFVREGYDFAFRFGRREDLGLVARPLVPYTMALAASPAYLKAHRPIRRPRDLAQHHCLGLRLWRQQDHWTLVGPEGQVETQAKGPLTINLGQGLRAAALADLGVIMQPAMLLEDDFAAGRLVRVLPDYAPKPRIVHLVYAPDRQLTTKHRRFADFMLRELRPADLAT